MTSFSTLKFRLFWEKIFKNTTFLQHPTAPTDEIMQTGRTQNLFFYKSFFSFLLDNGIRKRCQNRRLYANLRPCLCLEMCYLPQKKTASQISKIYIPISKQNQPHPSHLSSNYFIKGMFLFFFSYTLFLSLLSQTQLSKNSFVSPRIDLFPFLHFLE